VSRRLEHDHYGAPKRDAGVEGLGLFAPPEPTVPRWAETWGSLTDAARKAQRERWKELLLPAVVELSAAPLGVTASEVIAAGIERNHLWGERAFLTKYPRIYSWVGGWLAQLAREGIVAPKTAQVEGHGRIHLRRESTRDLSHSNEGFIYVRAA
jgi:hypothetical protein